MTELNHYYSVYNKLIRASIPTDTARDAAEHIASFQLAHLPMSVAVDDLVQAFQEMYQDVLKEKLAAQDEQALQEASRQALLSLKGELS